jgi:lipopolysaccharide transport system permease protein
MHKVIKRRTGLAQLDLKELWEYRELLGFLAWRDIAVRYKQTVVGIGWAFVRPFITMIVLTVVFGYIAKLPSENVPYAVLTFTALVPWQFFATGFGECSNSVLGNGHMINKVYFPRLILPIAAVAVATIDFIVSFFFLLLLMLIFGVMPSARVAFLPLFALLGFVFTLGLGIWFAALYVKYRDVRHFIPFIIQLGLYVSPVAFSSTVIPERYRLLYSMNPMVSVIDGFRWSLLGTASLHVAGVITSSVLAVVLLTGGIYYFKQMEREFADLI